MALYEVHARKWENGWELRVDGVGVTWSPTLADAESRAREYIAGQAELAEEQVHIDLLPRVSDELDRLALEARRALHEADEALRGATAKTRQAVAGLTAAGLTLVDISHYLGLSPQRITQLTGS
ncbi:hypothetical protein ACQEU5_01705 [Marinactinospora thermotolerans]|uniref:Uncharacterized protein n=1 Tax=Marinactinospora thermotolerans DSM 45154 TaxID=1122192 RepID=A0A1T4M7R8_9ACTN|nr:hypothetical protein [Marinactinospora thermotolerans]SJZ63053.1 hypothetical protein SAMN02745673_00985 [Marinactinospora thermotolerans DSM 45154]